MSSPASSRPLLICADLDGCAAAVAAAHPVDLDIRAPKSVDALAWCAAPLVLVSACCLARLRPQSPRPDIYLLATAGEQMESAATRGSWLTPAGVFCVPQDSGRLRAALRRVLTTPRQMIGVIGGTGGAGSSTLATALAFRALHRVRTVLLVDADTLGGSLGHLVGDLHVADTDLVGQLTLLDWDERSLDLPPAAALHVISQLAPRYPLTIVDLPRRLDGVSEVFVRDCTNLVLVVVRGDQHALAAARRVITSLNQAAGTVRLLAATRALHDCYTPAEVADALNLPLACHIDSDPSIGSISPGRVTGPLSTAAGQILTILDSDPSYDEG